MLAETTFQAIDRPISRDGQRASIRELDRPACAFGTLRGHALPWRCTNSLFLAGNSNEFCQGGQNQLLECLALNGAADDPARHY